MSEANMTMKLLIDKRNNKVLFAETGKECVDFLFHVLQLPIATVVNCLTKEAMVGSLGSLYDSLEHLSSDYLKANLSKLHLLKPRASFGLPPPLSFSTVKEAPAPKYNLYVCPKGCAYASDYSAISGASCPNCCSLMTRAMTYIPLTRVGYVKGLVTYMITDDLVVKPMSGILTMELLSKFNIKELDLLEHREVVLDMNQGMGMALLKASLVSKTVLTDVFLRQKEIEPIPGQPV